MVARCCRAPRCPGLATRDWTYDVVVCERVAALLKPWAEKSGSDQLESRTKLHGLKADHFQARVKFLLASRHAPDPIMANQRSGQERAAVFAAGRFR